MIEPQTTKGPIKLNKNIAIFTAILFICLLTLFYKIGTYQIPTPIAEQSIFQEITVIAFPDSFIATFIDTSTIMINQINRPVEHEITESVIFALSNFLNYLKADSLKSFTMGEDYLVQLNLRFDQIPFKNGNPGLTFKGIDNVFIRRLK